MYKARIFAFADEASPMIDEQIKAMKRNGLLGLEIRSVDGESVSSISMEKAKEVHRKIRAFRKYTVPFLYPHGKAVLRNIVPAWKEGKARSRHRSWNRYPHG